MNLSKLLFFITWFKGCIEIEKLHPLEGGYLRLKFRRDRRPGLPKESAWWFYPKYFWESLCKQVRWASLYARLFLISQRIKRDPQRPQSIWWLTKRDEVGVRVCLPVEELPELVGLKPLVEKKVEND